MAVARMSRLRLIGLKSDKNKIMNELVKSGSFEVVPSNSADAKFSDRSHLDKLLGKQAKVAFAISFLGSCATEYLEKKRKNDSEVKKGKSRPIRVSSADIQKKDGGRRIIGFDDFYDVAAKEYELLAVCGELEQISFARVENRSRLQKLRARCKTLAPYAGFPMKFSVLGDRGRVSVMLAHCAADRQMPETDVPVFYERYGCAGGTLLGIVMRTEDRDKIAAALVGAGFSLCTFSDDSTAAELINGCRADELDIENKDNEAMYGALNYYKYLSDLKVLYDVIGQEIEKTSAELEFACTRDTFVAEGWVPSDAADGLIIRVRDKTERIVTYLEDAKEEDLPPTLIVSKKIFKPYEDVTNMYSVPAYNEIDPNPFMALFFFLFFGIMIGDAGYGVILSIAAGLILRFCRLEKGSARLLALVGMGGISAIIWGVLFGGVFSISAVPPLWFNPINEPLMMLGVSIVLGVVQILTGYALKAAKSFRAGKPLDAVLDSVFIFILFGGIACMALDMLLDVNAPLTYIGLGMLGAALSGILLTAGRHNKGVLSKIMGGFSGLYGLVNLLSDVLSYARLFGLGLASGAIGSAFNTLGSMLFSIPVAGYVFGIIVLIPLHAFNLGIGVLGAYVHNARLQFLEFYGKFYDGGGRLFSPLGEKTKYVRFS